MKPWIRFLDILAASLLVLTAPAWSDEQSERRLVIGAKFFPSLVAADLALSEKRDADGRLHLAVLYNEPSVAIERTLQRLREIKEVQAMPIVVDDVRYGDLPQLAARPPAALFLAEPSLPGLAAANAFGRAHRRLVFSPFYGDVRLGATAGISVADRILPLVSPEALQASGLRLQPFLLGIAVTRE